MTITWRSHKCSADGCDTDVPINMLMCRKHWYMVPKDLRERVFAGYRRGMDAEYDVAVAAAIDGVARLEKAKA